MMYTIVQIGFPTLTLVFFYLLIKEFKLALPKTGWSEERQKKFIFRLVMVPLVWGVFIFFWSFSGMFSRFDLFPANAAPVILIPLIATMIFMFYKSTAGLIQHIPQHRVIRLQVFRVLVEILLWILFVEKLMPVQMSFEGRNFDILAGITAPFVALLAYQNKLSKPILIIWNLVCLGLLINIVTIAMLSMPTPFQYFTNEPANTIVTKFPISVLPGFLVPLAGILHFISLRKLLIRPIAL